LVRTARGRLVHLALLAWILVAVTSCALVPALGSATSWWRGDGISACGPPAVYRVDGGPEHPVGDCAGLLVVPPTHVTVAVGSEVDVHVTEEGVGPTGAQLAPIFPTPTSTDSLVLNATSIADGGSTESFLAVGPGTADLLTKGLCLISDTAPDAVAICPLIEVGVS
jgi:hypothetical protein